jgi:hypothetical protein
LASRRGSFAVDPSPIDDDGDRELNGANCRFDHRTRRTGRRALFAQNAACRKRWAENLAWVADALRLDTGSSRRE